MPTTSAPNLSSSKTWTVGTLTYTTGGLVILFCWLLWGDFALSMRDRSVPSVIQLLFRRFEASDTLVGILMVSLPAAMSLFLGPIISYKSDRHRGHWGRRIPYILIPTPIAVGSMIGLAYSSHLGARLDNILGAYSPGLDLVTLLVLGLFWTLFEFACITTASVFGGLINDVVPTEVLGRFFGLFRIFSLLAAIVFNYWIFAHAESHFLEIFIGIGLFFGFGFTLMCLNVKEGSYPPPEKTPHAGFFPAARLYFKECFGKPYYYWIFAAGILTGMVASPVNMYSVFYAKAIHMDLHIYGKCLVATYCISLVLSYPLGYLVDRFHPLVMSLVAIGLYSIATLISGFIVRDAATFFIALLIHGVFSGMIFTVNASLSQRLLPRERFAALSSAGGILGCLSTIPFAPIIGSLLDHLQHDYRYTFFLGSTIGAIAFAVNFGLYRRFLKLGGPKNYVAP